MKKKRIKFLMMEHLGMRLTTYCNLNCKDCADLIPRTKRCHYDYDLLMQDVGKVLQVVDFISEILLGGGETFLYPKIKDVIEWGIKEPKIGKVIIVTNGTLTPSEEILALLQNPKVVVRVSGYGETVVPNRKSLMGILGERRIAVDDLENMTWRDVGNFKCRERTETQIERVWDKCIMNDCVGMTSRGRIYWCSRSIAADDLDVYPSPLEGEYVDVRNTPVELLGEKLEKFYELNYISTCNYCDGINASVPIVQTAVQMVRKDLVLDMLSFLFELKHGTADRAMVEKWIFFLKDNVEQFVYETDFSEMLDISIEAYKSLVEYTELEDACKTAITKSLNSLLTGILEKYSFQVTDKTGKIPKNSLKYEDCFVRKNSIIIVIQNKEDELPENADIILTDEDLKSECAWEKQTGERSVLRCAFVSEF